MGFKRNPKTGAMEITRTGDPVVDNLDDRKETTISKIRELAYERLRLTRQVEEIDKFIGQLEGAQVANDLVQKDIDLRRTIIQAQKETNEKRAEQVDIQTTSIDPPLVPDPSKRSSDKPKT